MARGSDASEQQKCHKPCPHEDWEQDYHDAHSCVTRRVEELPEECRINIIINIISLALMGALAS